MPYGEGPYGGSSFPFNVTGATPVDFQTVDLTFSNAVLPGIGETEPITYTVDHGLSVLAVMVTSSTTVRLFTTPQNEGTVYTVTVDRTALTDTKGQTLSVNQASFTGIGSTLEFLVSDLDAQSVCSGRAVSLAWSNPTGTNHVKILRRLRAWPFDLTDTYDVVYDGTPIEEFTDTGVAVPVTSVSAPVAVGASSIQVGSSAGYSIGDSLRVEKLTGPVQYDLVSITAIPDGTHVTVSPPLTHAYVSGDRVSKSTQLQIQTYYYYTVLVSASSTPTTYDIGDASRAFSLSIDDSFNSKDDFFWKRAPNVMRRLDALPVAQGGGDGFLDRWFSVMGCWLNLMRGYFNAIALNADPDKAPFHVLTAKNQELGIDPEGFAYDFDIVRRPLTSLAYVYKRRGTCPGIIETVRMFTKWDATCVDFGSNSCRGGASNFEWYDGTSVNYFDQGPSGTQITQKVVAADGTSQITDTGASFGGDGLFADGTLRGYIGDIACIDSNVGQVITTKPPPAVTLLSANASANATSLSVSSTQGLQPGMVIQLVHTTPTAGAYPSEIVQIDTISPGTPGTLTIQGPGLRNAYPTGSLLTIGKTILRSEYVGSTSSTHSSFTITDPKAHWVQNQWVGYKLLDNANNLRNVVSNEGNTVTVDNILAGPPPDGTYAIASGFTLGGNFAARVPTLKYKASNGQHSTWFEPTFDITTRGTVYDPYNRLYYGTTVRNGVFGPTDVGVFILGSVPLITGRASSGGGAVFQLDPLQPAPMANALKGNFLNPNQNQEQMFEILANSTTTLTVAGDISSLIVPGQAYYVLKPRDKTRFQRVSARLRNEFSDTDVRTHVLFV